MFFTRLGCVLYCLEIVFNLFKRDDRGNAQLVTPLTTRRKVPVRLTPVLIGNLTWVISQIAILFHKRKTNYLKCFSLFLFIYTSGFSCVQCAISEVPLKSKRSWHAIFFALLKLLRFWRFCICLAGVISNRSWTDIGLVLKCWSFLDLIHFYFSCSLLFLPASVVLDS